MSIRKVVAGLLITAGIAIMAVPFFWRATGEKQTEQLISEFEQTLEDDYDEETDVEEEQTSISKEDEAILKEGGVIGIIEISNLGNGWGYEMTPAELAKKDEFYSIYWSEYNLVKESGSSELRDYLNQDRPSFEARA